MASMENLPRELLAEILKHAADGGYIECVAQTVCKAWAAVMSPTSVDALYVPWILSATAGAKADDDDADDELYRTKNRMREADFYGPLRALVTSAGAGKHEACRGLLVHVKKNAADDADVDFYCARAMEAAIRAGHPEVYDLIRREQKLLSATPLRTLYAALEEALNDTSSPPAVSAAAFGILTRELRRAFEDETTPPSTFLEDITESARLSLLCDATRCCMRMGLPLAEWDAFTKVVATADDLLIGARGRGRVLDCALNSGNREFASVALRNLGDSVDDLVMLELWIRHVITEERAQYIVSPGSTDVFLEIPHVHARIEVAALLERANVGDLSSTRNPLLVASGTVAESVRVWEHLLGLVEVRAAHERKSRVRSFLSALMEDVLDATYMALDCVIRENKEGATSSQLAGFEWAHRRLKAMMAPVIRAEGGERFAAVTSWDALLSPHCCEDRREDHLEDRREDHHRRVILRSLCAPSGYPLVARRYEDVVRIVARIGDYPLICAALDDDARYDDDVMHPPGGNDSFLTAVALAESLIRLRRDATATCDALSLRMREQRACMSASAEIRKVVTNIVRAGSTVALNYVLDRDTPACVHGRCLAVECLVTVMQTAHPVYFESCLRDLVRGALRKTLASGGRKDARDVDVACALDRAMLMYQVHTSSDPEVTLCVMRVMSEHWHPTRDFSVIILRTLVVAARVGNGALVRVLLQRTCVHVADDVLDRVARGLMHHDDADTMDVLLRRHSPRWPSMELLKVYTDRAYEHGHVRMSRLLRRTMRNRDQ